MLRVSGDVVTHFFTLTPGTDNFTGLSGDYNEFHFTPSTLQSTDTITGGAAGSFLDILVATAGGTISSAQFSGVSLVEQLNLSDGGNDVTLRNSMVAGSSAGYFAVVDGGGNDTVDASTVSTTPIVFFAAAGSDTFKGGGGNDAVSIAPANLTSADTFQGGAGIDNLYFSTAGTVADSAFTNVSGIEGVGLSSGGNNITLTNGLVAGSNSGSFAVSDGAGNDSVDASGVTNGTPLAFFASTGNDSFRGGNGPNGYVFTAADLTSADTVQGGTGAADNLFITTPGTLSAAGFTNVTGIEGLILANGTNNVTLTNGLVAGTSAGYFVVAGGAGNDTIDASGVTNGTPLAFFASTGNDSFRGGNGPNGYVFTAADLTSADTVQGGSGVDNLFISTAGTVGAAAFAQVTNIEALVLANGTNNVTLTNSLVAGTSIGYFAVAGGTGNDTVDASGVTNGTAIAFYGTTGGNDNFTGGNGSDAFLFAAGQLTASDVVTGGGGTDTLWMTTAGTTSTAALAGVTGMEGVFLQAGGTFNLANGITAAASFGAAGSSAVDTFDASAVTAYKVIFNGNGGADVLKGGTQDDTFGIADSAFASINGNGGIDRITLTAASQSFDLHANVAKITNLEVIDLNSSLGSTLTLAGTDIAQVNAAGESLYVIGDVDDTVNAGNGYTQIASGVVNNAVAPGHTFYEYQHSSGALLFIDTAITSLTATTGNGSTSVAEGVTAGTTVFNAQQSGATFYVLGGADAALFSIDVNGHISFNSAPDYETPQDQGGNNVYNLTVTSSDGTATPNFVEDVTITVTDVAPAPASDSNGNANHVAEGAANGTAVGIIAFSTDPAGTTPGYTLSNNAGGRFAIDSSGVVIVANGAAIDYETAPGAGHSYSITVQATAGALSTPQDFTIFVDNVNEAPVNSVPGFQTVDEDTALVLSGANTISISDVDAFGGDETVTLQVGHGALTLNGTTGLAFSLGDGAADSIMTFSGTVAAINAALNGLSYQGNQDFNGPESISITTNDNGNTGSGGAKQDVDSVAITVAAVNDAPTASNLTQSLTIDEDAAATTLFGTAPAVSDVDSPTLTATLTLSDAAAGVLTGGGFASIGMAGQYSFTGTQAAVNAALAAVNYDSAQDFNGTVDVNVLIDDGASGPQGTNPTGTVSITVNPVNDAPVASNLTQSLTIDEDAAATPLFGTAPVVSDVDTTLTATLSLSDPAAGVLSGGGFASTGSAGQYSFTGTQADVNAALAAVSFDSSPNFNGTVDVGVLIDDGLSGPAGTVSITVNAVNDAPTVVNGNTATLAAINEDNTAGAATLISTIFGTHFSDAADAVTNGSSANGFAGIAIVGNAASGGQGVWEWRVAGNFATISTAVSDTNAYLLTAVSPTTFIRFRPAPDFNGTAPALTVRLIDNSSGAVINGTSADASVNGGTTRYSSDTIALSQTIVAVDDPPVNTLPSGPVSVVQNTATAITGVSVSDVDASPQDVSVTLSVLHGTLDVRTNDGVLTNGLDAWQVSGDTTSTVTLTGTTAEINASLAASNGLLYLSDLNFTGSAPTEQLTIATNDLGHTGTGGPRSDTDSVGITVTGTPPLNAAPGGVQALTPTSGGTHLTQAQLDSVVAAAIANWAAAGASTAQLAVLAALTFTVADLAGTRVGEHTPGHILIDPSAAGHGWFVDSTPNDNSEFTHAANAAGTDLDTDPSNAAAGHLDLLTAVSHEMGHALGLDDKVSPTDAHDLMYLNLVDGERRLPDATDVAEADGSAGVQAAEAALPLSAQAAVGTPIIVGTAGNDTIDAGHGGNILFGGAGADHFVFGSSTPLDAPTPAQVTHVADYSAAQGDTFDFSAITSAFHNSSVNDSLLVRAVEDVSGKFAMLQVDHIDPFGPPSGPNWVNVAQLDGAHAGDAVNVLIDNHSLHLAQIHVDLL
jgi:hypothetical protein